MSDIAIRVENLSKLYHIGAQQRHDTLRDALVSALPRIRRISRCGEGNSSNSSHSRRKDIDLWALRDVSFEVNRGEVVGIIGRNGAGKSTLLKILSRITEPTKGQVDIHGRVGSLLEVGTGFHPELTGRENIYLNGAILGMRKTEIASKFDEIVAFSDIEKFLDTPVKRYSSGMYVRLAFAVAAHLEPEILLVDEVLAVGDAAFQQKCLSKMGSVATGGRTVLFVSHNMGAVKKLCKEIVLIDRGQVAFFGDANAAVSRYLSTHSGNRGEFRAESALLAPGDGRFRLLRVSVKNQAESTVAAVGVDEPVFLELEYEIIGRLDNLRVGYRLLAMDGTVAFTSGDTDPEGAGTSRESGTYVSKCIIPRNLLNSGDYSVTVACDKPHQEVLLFEEGIVSFQVQLTGGAGASIPDNRLGIFRPLLEWSVVRVG